MTNTDSTFNPTHPVNLFDAENIVPFELALRRLRLDHKSMRRAVDMHSDGKLRSGIVDSVKLDGYDAIFDTAMQAVYRLALSTQ